MPDLNLNTTTGVNVQPLFTPVLNRYVLDVAKPFLAFAQCGQKAKVPKGEGKTVAWDKYVPLPLAKTPLVEGATPNGTPLSVTRQTGTPSQYGAYVATSDEFDFYSYDPSPKVLNLTELLGQNAAETLDSLTCDVVAAGTNVQYAGGRASRAAITSSDKLTFQEIKKAVRSIKDNKGKRYKDGNYICILDPDTAFDLTNSDEWKNVKYNDPKDMYAGEIGVLWGVRFLETTETASDLLKTYNESAEVKIHFVYVMAADAYGVTEPKDNVEIIAHDKHSIGGPLDQYSTMGWKAHHLAKILVPEWLVRIECAVSA